MNNIPLFPNFKNIELSDKEEIKSMIKKAALSPYADFNFANMWAWDIQGKMKLSRHKDNLVVLFNDYVTGKEFFSFIGNNNISETARDLIEFSKKKNFKENALKLIPEEIAVELSKSGFMISLDRNSCDHVYEVEKLISMENLRKRNSHKRNAKKFPILYPKYQIKNSSLDKIGKDEYLEVFKKWSDNKLYEKHFDLNEYKAFCRCLDSGDKDIEIISIYVDNILIGFTLYEIVSSEYAIAHFSKTNIEYSSVSDFLISEEAKFLSSKNIKYYNWEQDLGIPGLRAFKESFKPAFLLKKFYVELKNQ